MLRDTRALGKVSQQGLNGRKVGVRPHVHPATQLILQRRGRGCNGWLESISAVTDREPPALIRLREHRLQRAAGTVLEAPDAVLHVNALAVGQSRLD